MTLGIVTLAGFTMSPPAPPDPRIAVDTFTRAAGLALGVTEFGGFAWGTLPAGNAAK